MPAPLLHYPCSARHGMHFHSTLNLEGRKQPLLSSHALRTSQLYTELSFRYLFAGMVRM